MFYIQHLKGKAATDSNV